MFYGCSSLTSIKVDGNNKYYSSSESVLFNKEKTVLIAACLGTQSGEYTIPDSVTSIGDSAFHGCSGLTSVTMGNCVTEIGKHAFKNCSSLTSVTMPDSVTLISEGAFYDCENLTDIAYKGTKSQWYSISKGEDWKAKIGNYTVHCTDGDIVK